MTPETRKEKYLAKMAGDNTINVPEPITREEQYLYQISQNPGGGGGGGTTSGITQEQADARYLKLSGGAMTGNIDIGGNNLDNVSYVKAAGSYENAGIQFGSNGTIMTFITGYSKALELSANSVNMVNHNVENVAGISMYNNGIITGLGEPTNDTDAANKQYVDNVSKYRQDETICGVWIDGKPIYRKVFVTTTPSEVNSVSEVATYSDISVDKVIKLNGVTEHTANEQEIFSEIERHNGTSYLHIYADNTNKRIIMSTSEQTWTNITCYIIFEYTKQVTA